VKKFFKLSSKIQKYQTISEEDKAGFQRISATLPSEIG
jgi:hypothetical protein